MRKTVLCLTIIIIISGLIILSLWLSDKKTSYLNGTQFSSVHPKGWGPKKALVKTPKDSFIKSFYKKDASRYFKEKRCYEKLEDNSHFPNLIR